MEQYELEDINRRFKRSIKRFAIYSMVLFALSLIGGDFEKKDAKPVHTGPVDTRIYSKAYESAPHTRTLPPLNSPVEVKVKGGKTYEADVDFEELMDKLGIDPEDIRDYIE